MLRESELGSPHQPSRPMTADELNEFDASLPREARERFRARRRREERETAEAVASSCNNRTHFFDGQTLQRIRVPFRARRAVRISPQLRRTRSRARGRRSTVARRTRTASRGSPDDPGPSERPGEHHGPRLTANTSAGPLCHRGLELLILGAGA